MFGLRQLGIWFFAAAAENSSSYGNNNKYSFQDSRLRLAVEICHDAKQLPSPKDACDEFMSGIVIGRSIVQKLQENKLQGNDIDDNDDDPDLALDWLVSCYIELFNSRVKLNDWETARKDAWAACMYSMYTNIEALECMLTVCTNTNDSIGELQTLKQILAAYSTTTTSSGSGGGTSTTMTLEEIEKRIQVLEKDLF